MVLATTAPAGHGHAHYAKDYIEPWSPSRIPPTGATPTARDWPIIATMASRTDATMINPAVNAPARKSQNRGFLVHGRLTRIFGQGVGRKPTRRCEFAMGGINIKKMDINAESIEPQEFS